MFLFLLSTRFYSFYTSKTVLLHSKCNYTDRTSRTKKIAIKMKSKLKIATLMMTLVIIGASLGLWALKANKLKKMEFAPKESPVTIQLIPLPIVVSSNDQKDKRLYELLVEKTSTQVSFANASFDIEPLFMATPLDLKSLSINFAYNDKTRQVDFQGQSNRLPHLKISGHYEFTPKNGIRYFIKIHDKYKTWLIDSTYAPAYQDNELQHNETVTGHFSLESSDFLQTIYNFGGAPFLHKYPFLAHGNFVKKDNFFKMENLHIKINELEANVQAQFKDKNLSLDATLNRVNLDKILEYIPKGGIDRAISLLAKNFAKASISGTVHCDEVIMNQVPLKSFLLLFSQKEKSKDTLEISELKFYFPDKTAFNASAKVRHTNSALETNGTFSVSDVGGYDLGQLLGIGTYYGGGALSLSSNFELTSTNAKLKNIKLEEEGATLTGDLSLSRHPSSRTLVGNVEVSNYRTEALSFIQYLLHKNSLLSKIQALDYENALKQSHKENFLKDITLKFVNLKTSDSTVKKISTRYIEAPDYIELEYFKAEDPDFNLRGSILLHTKNSVPNLKMKFEGDKVNMTTFNDVVLKPIMYQIDPSTKKTTIFSFPQFNSAIGEVSLNLKNPDAKARVSAVNCTAQLSNAKLVLNNDCLVNLFDGQANINGEINLGKILGYNISFSHKNANMNKFIGYFLGKNNKITGKGTADLEGTLSANNFSTITSMTNALNGVIELKSEHIGLSDVDLQSLTSKYGKLTKAVGTRKRNRTEFHNVNGGFSLTNGKLESKNLSFITKENIHGKTNLCYKLLDKNINGILSLAYFDKIGKIDGFNITFYGDVRKLNTKLGTYIAK